MAPDPPDSAQHPKQRTGLLLRDEATWGLDQTERFMCGNGYSPSSKALTSQTHNQC